MPDKNSDVALGIIAGSSVVGAAALVAIALKTGPVPGGNQPTTTVLPDNSTDTSGTPKRDPK